MAEKREKKNGGGALFIPGGLLIGMGLGFVFNSVPAGMFIGLGAGLAAFGISILAQKK